MSERDKEENRWGRFFFDTMPEGVKVEGVKVSGLNVSTYDKGCDAMQQTTKRNPVFRRAIRLEEAIKKDANERQRTPPITKYVT